MTIHEVGSIKNIGFIWGVEGWWKFFDSKIVLFCFLGKKGKENMHAMIFYSFQETLFFLNSVFFVALPFLQYDR